MSSSLTRPLRAVRQWLRLIQPPFVALSLAIAGALICETIYFTIGLAFGQWPSAREILSPRDTLLVFAALFSGAERVHRTHPALGKEHFLWLARLPWVRGKPLPRGPVHLVLQDLLFVGFLMLLGAHQRALPWPAIPFAFVLAYLASLAWGLWLTGEALAGYATLFLLGLAVHCLSWSPVAALLVATAAYALGISAYWRSLLHFPWFDEITAATRLATRQARANQCPPAAAADAVVTATLTETPLIWPYGLLHHHLDRRTIPRRDAWAFGLLVGWWAAALLRSLPNFPAEICFVIAVALPALACMLLRLQRYTAGHAPPLSIWGRLRTGRWIIPGYDRVFLAPLAVFVASVALPPLALSFHLPPPYAAGAICSLIVLLTLLAPPPLRHWQLTAPVRLRPIKTKTPSAVLREI